MPKGIFKRTKAHNNAISRAKQGHRVSIETRRKISIGNKGNKLSKKHIKQIRLNLIGKKGEKSRHWLGAKVSVAGMHCWLRSEYGTPSYCEHCKRSGRKYYDWASIDHKYVRDVTQFIRLCKSCHRKYDIKFNKSPVFGRLPKFKALLIEGKK